MNARKQYANQRFSILGDSISTLDGYSVPSDAAFYTGSKKMEAEVWGPADTWWGQVIKSLGGTLLVNQSISGSMVCKHPACETSSYGCSRERTSALGREGLSPNVIMIFLGINDWGWGFRPDSKEDGEDLSIFSVAYRIMLDRLIQSYPRAELWCLTLPVSTCTRNRSFAFPYTYGGRHIEEYCAVIRACAEEKGCRLIDLYGAATPHDTIDGFHPNADGMKTLARRVLEQL